MQNIIIINSILFSILFSYILNIITIPFETYNPLLTKDKNKLELIKKASDDEIIDTLSKNLIFVNVEIGETKQNIPTFIEMSANDFYFRDLKMKDIIPYGKDIIYLNYTYNDNYILNKILKLNYYNSSLSKTYKFITSCPEYLQEFFLDRDSCANETIYFTFKNNITEKGIKKPITLFITFKGFEKLDHRPGIIGLNVKDSDFILKLKKYTDIKKYIWTIKYINNSEEKGELIIGDFPHIYDENKYNEDNLRSAKIIKQKELEWNLNFDEVYIKYIDKNDYYYFEKNEIIKFSIEEYFILATKEYFIYIEENFFYKYLNEGICKRQKYNKAGYYNLFFHVICHIKDNNKRKEFFNNFPYLIFYNKEMNCNFTLDSKDLFTIIPNDNRILFNIELGYGSEQWVLGKPFFKKYQLIFDSDSKMINYYDNNFNEKKKKNIVFKKENKIKIVIIIFLIVLAFIIGIIFGRILCSKYNRKIRANELEEKYSYISKDNDLKNFDSKNTNYITNYQIIE